MKRRDFLRTTVPATFVALGGGSLLTTLTGCAEPEPEPNLAEPGGFAEGLFVGGITTSLLTEGDYITTVRGRVPAALAGGVLYKNGPGLFERDGFRKRTIVDGDGMVNAYFFQEDGSVRFVNKFVRTPKYELEEEAARFLYPTWTTEAPGSLGPEEAANSSQAGVSVWSMFGGKLLAFDESNFPESLDPNTLETQGIDLLGISSPEEAVFSAHPKIIEETGEVVMFGVNYLTQSLDLTVFAADGSIVESRKHPFEPIRYLHDFFVTPRYIVAAVHPAVLNFETFFTGATIRDSLEWDESLGMRWLIFERGSTEGPVEIQGQARWMWHSANIYERGGELVCDWIGYDDPGHFLGAGAEWEGLMEGVVNQTGATGRMLRTVLDPLRGALREEVLSDDGNYEFPMVQPSQLGGAHEKVWTAVNPKMTPLWTAIRSINARTGAVDTFDFGDGHVVTEPNIALGNDGRLYALIEVSRSATGRASLAVFDAQRLAEGPIAEVELDHHLPVRFHGQWVGA